jgi:hypothetical protein
MYIVKGGKPEDGIAKVLWIAPKRRINNFERFDELGTECMFLGGIVKSSARRFR